VKKTQANLIKIWNFGLVLILILTTTAVALPPCIVNLKMNDADVSSYILHNSAVGDINLDTTGISNPTLSHDYIGETSIFKISDNNYIGWLDLGGEDSGIRYMTSTTGLSWNVSPTSLDLTPTIIAGQAEYQFVFISDSNYIMCVHNVVDGKEYAWDVTNHLSPILLNNGNAILSPSVAGWDTHLYNVAVTNVNGVWHMLYEGDNGVTIFLQGYTTVTPAHNPPLATDNITFSNAAAPIAVGACPYITSVPDRNGLLAIIATLDMDGELQLQLYPVSLANDLNKVSSWVPGAILINNGDIVADSHLITNYSSEHPILMIYNNNYDTSECYINLTLDELYDRAAYKTSTMYRANSATGKATTAGKIGGAMFFNGNNWNYAQFGTYDPTYSWNITPILNWSAVDWSISTWARQDSSGPQRITYNRLGPGDANYWELGVDGSGFYHVEFTGSSAMTITAKPSLSTWHHYVLTYNHTTHIAKAYLDNQIAGTLDTATLSPPNTIGDQTNFLVLAQPDSVSNYFNGAIDAFMVFSGTLSAADVAYLYNVCEFALAGDLNNDCKVDFADLEIMVEQWLQPPGLPSADIWPPDGNDIVNFEDFAVMAENWLIDCHANSSNPACVPE
jgi:hypothetical protein